MNIYLVTGKAQETNTSGVIERIEMVVYGAYTTEARAAAYAEKYGGTVMELVADQEGRKVAQHWVNPGFYAESS